MKNQTEKNPSKVPLAEHTRKGAKEQGAHLQDRGRVYKNLELITKRWSLRAGA